MNRARHRIYLASLALFGGVTVGCASGAPKDSHTAATTTTETAKDIEKATTTTAAAATTTTRPSVTTTTAGSGFNPKPAAGTGTPATKAPTDGTVHGYGDAANTRQAVTTGFDTDTRLAWAVQNLKLNRTARPIVADDATYATLNDRIVAIDNTTGKLRWSYPYKSGKGPVGNPVLVGDRLVFLRFDYTVTALDTHTGVEGLTVNLPDGKSYTPPVAVKDTMYTASTGTIFAINLTSGAVDTVTADIAVGLSSTMIVGEGKAFVVSTPTTNADTTNRLTAVDLVKKTTLWEKTATNLSGFKTGLLYGEGVVLTTGLAAPATSTSYDAVSAFDATTGKDLWSFTKPAGADNEETSLGVRNGSPLYYSNGVAIISRSNGYTGYDLHTGKVMWTADPQQFLALPFGVQLVSDLVVTNNGVAYLLVHPGNEGSFRIVGFDVKTGAKLSEVATGIKAVDADTGGEFTLTEAPTYLIARGGTLIAYFEGLGSLAGFTDTTPAATGGKAAA